MFIPYSFFGGVDDQVVEATGGTIYDIYSGSYVWRLHDFTTPDETTTVATFTVNSGSSSDARILLVAAGGHGSANGIYNSLPSRGAGGGGGGVKLFNSQTITTGSYTVTTGGQATDLSIAGRPGNSGSGSSFVGNAINISTEGGGGGGGAGSTPLSIPPTDGLNGGSGGGAGANSNPGSGTIVGGFDGGNDAFVSNVYYGGGGGGSAEAGGNAGGGKGGDGGNGKQIRLSPYMTLDYYGGGGSGGSATAPGQAGSGSNQLPYARNNMGEADNLGGGSNVNSAKQGVVRIMYPLYQFNPADTQTYRFHCTADACAIQYVTTSGTLIDGESLASGSTVDKVVPRDSQARITRSADGSSGGTITKIG